MIPQRKIYLLIMTVTIILGLTNNSFSDDAGKLAVDKMKELLSGARMDSENKSGIRFTVRYLANGTMEFENENGWADKGKWYFDNDGLYCSKWTRIREGDPVCGEFHFIRSVQNGTKIFFKCVKGRCKDHHLIISK